MDKIKEYVEAMFATLPNTKEAVEMKLGILESMEDKYNELLEQGKSEEEALGTVIAQFGSVEEIKREFGGQETQGNSVQKPKRDVALEAEYENFLKKYTILMAISIALYIISPISCILLERVSEVLAPCALLAIVAAATGIIVAISIQKERYRERLGLKKTRDHGYGGYGDETNPEDGHRNDTMTNVPSGPIFMGATIIFLMLGFFMHAWNPGWIVFLVASFLVALLRWFEKNKQFR